VHFAVEFLTQNTKGLLDNGCTSTPLSAEGKDVVVIGGGDTAATASAPRCATAAAA